MVDFSVFDSILDVVFVVDQAGRIAYCNDSAATFTATSVRRVMGKLALGDVLLFGEPGLWPFDENSPGRTEPTPFIETPVTVVKAGRSAKIQLAVRPMGDGAHWGFFMKDVSLEETLAGKYRVELAKTEAYARNLETLVAARTAELNTVNQTLNAILNSLGQGFFTFDAAGDCGAVFTKACEDVLEGAPPGRKAWDVLAAGDKLIEFKRWTESLFKEYLPFEDLRPLGPDFFPHSQGKRIRLDYYPIRRLGAIAEVVVVATDQTNEYAAQVALEAERQYAGMILKFVQNKAQFLEFLASAGAQLSHLEALAQATPSMSAETVRESLRDLHTLEGEAGAFSLRDLRQAARSSQHALEAARNAHDFANYREVLRQTGADFARFLNANREVFGFADAGVAKRTEVSLDDLEEFLARLRETVGPSPLTEDFRARFMTVTIGERLKYFDGLAQLVAEKLGKQLRPLQIHGGAIRFYPEPYQAVFATLVHAFRNAVDHGLETPDEREWAGKPPAGQLEVFIARRDGRLSLSIRDDGRGIDPAVIRAKLPEKFPGRDFSGASDAEIIQAVCLPGFSSKDDVGEFSGRGVGLDALAAEVAKLGGQLTIQSQVGRGTSIEIDLPELGPDLPAVRSA